MAVEMLRMSASDGVTHVVATPHCNFRYPFEPRENRSKAADLQAAIGDSPRILLGCDFHLSFDNIRRLTEEHGPFTVNGTQYVLVEFDDFFVPNQMDHVFYEIQVAGYIPILTHPERNAVCRRKLDSIYNWITRGCLVQATAQSYLGGFGQEALRASERMLDLNLIHIFASDAHDTRHRTPLLSPAYEKVAAHRGRELADLLFTRNPECVIHGKPLSPGPEAVPPHARKRMRKWWPFPQR